MTFNEMDRLKKISALRASIANNTDFQIRTLEYHEMGKNDYGIKFNFKYKNSIEFQFYLDDVDRVCGMVYLLTDQQHSWKQYA
jgi:hypothetical protein